MKIAIIGANGFLGSKIVEVLNRSDKYEVIEITRENYSYYCKIYQDIFFDILINANGNSNKYWANTNPEGDYERSVQSVIDSIKDFRYMKYVYISSIDAERPCCFYGKHKHLAESYVKRCFDWLIIRPCLIIGKTMKKGKVFDILNNKKIYVTKDSRYHLITDVDIAERLEFDMLDKEKMILKYYSPNNISVEDIASICQKELNIDVDAKKESYWFLAPSKFNNCQTCLNQIL